MFKIIKVLKTHCLYYFMLKIFSFFFFCQSTAQPGPLCALSIKGIRLD